MKLGKNIGRQLIIGLSIIGLSSAGGFAGSPLVKRGTAQNTSTNIVANSSVATLAAPINQAKSFITPYTSSVSN